MSKRTNIFITGMGRSGTTLIEKLLSNHDKIDILSQPFPLLFIESKKRFLRSIGESGYFVLNQCMEDRCYSQEQFDEFIDTIHLSCSELFGLFSAMGSYSGQCTKHNVLPTINNDKKIIGLKNLYLESIELFDVADKLFVGSKEIMCEEFLPYLCDNGFKCLIIIRDPRDVVASVNYPIGHKYLGSKKPTLFIVKTWRKSIEYIRYLSGQKNFLFIRYEDLVCNPYFVLDKITNFLELEPFKPNQFEKGISDRNGELWKANSSFHSKNWFISPNSVGKYMDVLSGEEIKYIETVCFCDMKMMQYGLSSIPDRNIICDFRDHDLEYSKHLDRDYSSLPENIQKEILRFESLKAC
ncbi:MAG: sulfotransferase [Desulfobulbaceae bacterium]|jgi:hypothetical protein|nr:sulfotransferase [Desulfobulbaceae bacterium]